MINLNYRVVFLVLFTLFGISAGYLVENGNGVGTANSEATTVIIVPDQTRFLEFMELGRFENRTDELPNPYRSVGAWGELPDGRKWGAVTGVYPDGKGNIWVMERCGKNSCLGSDIDPILKFDSDGNLLKSFGGGLFAWPHGFFKDQEGNIWVTDAAGYWLPDAEPWKDKEKVKGHTVYKFSPDGEILLELGEPGVPGNGRDHFNMPTDVVVDKNGYIFITDGHQVHGNNRVVKFGADGTFIKEWGGYGTAYGKFREPHAIDIDSQGRVFVGDRMNNRIQLFDKEGNFLKSWSQFGRPSGIYINDDDMMYVADSESNYKRNAGWARGIRIGSAKDGWVRYFVPDPEPHPEKAGTSGAEYVAVDNEGNLYGAEIGPRKLNKYIRLWPHDNR